MTEETKGAPLSPSEALTYILETIRDRGWEMPRTTTMYIDGPSEVRFMWRAGHEMALRRGGATDGIVVWRQVAPTNQSGRAWPTTTRTNIDAALGFLLGNEAAE